MLARLFHHPTHAEVLESDRAARFRCTPARRNCSIADRKQDLDTYLWGMEVIDFLNEHPSVKFSPEEFVGLLTKLQPRLYSVASSLRAFPDQVHFIVDVVRYESHGRSAVAAFVHPSWRNARSNVPVPVYPSSAKHFHLPDDPNAPIIMVGPGTGVAPFRAFLQERQALGAKGKNWLFFGAQREKCDYAYKEDFDSIQARWHSDPARLRLVARSSPQDLCPESHAGERGRNLEMARL